MSDIRKTGVLDDFNRPDETPLSDGGKWARTDGTLWAHGLALKNLKATHYPGDQVSDSYWNPTSWSGDLEAWGKQGGGGTSGIAWGLALWHDPGGTGAVDGYRFRAEVGAADSQWVLYKYVNTTRSTLDTGSSLDAAYVNGFGVMLIRRNGNDVEGWSCLFADQTTWTLQVSATDADYTNDMYVGFGITDNSRSQLLNWNYVGGGIGPATRTQFFRRPSN